MARIGQRVSNFHFSRSFNIANSVAFLVGEAFMRAPDPGMELARLFG